MAIESDRPVTVILQGPIGVRLENEIITALQTIVGPDGAPVSVSGSGSGTMTTITLMRGRTVSGAEEPVLLEDTRELRTLLAGWDGAAPIRALFEATGEQKITLHGKDEAGNIDPLRTDPSGVLWMRAYEQSVIAAPAILAAADAVLWTPPLPNTIAELYEIDFLLVNVAGVVTGPVSVGVDIGAVGALAIPEFWVYQEMLPWPGSSGWRGTFLCRGLDTIRGWNAAGANLSTIHFRVRRIDTNV